LIIAILDGVGGLSAAIVIKLAEFEVEVYERQDMPSQIGAGIVCWPNASFVLEQLGALDEVAKVSGLLSYMNRFSSNGEPIGSLNINELSQLTERLQPPLESPFFLYRKRFIYRQITNSLSTGVINRIGDTRNNGWYAWLTDTTWWVFRLDNMYKHGR